MERLDMQRGLKGIRQCALAVACPMLVIALAGLEIPMKAQNEDTPKPTAESRMRSSTDQSLLFQAELQQRSEMTPAVTAEGREGKLVGSGDGSVRGSKIRGKVRWSNFEKVGDKVCQMNLAGYIETDDGARVDFDSTGYAVLVNPPQWNTAGTMRFTTKDKRYDWLNGKLSTWRGKFDSASLRATMYAFTIQFEASASSQKQR